MSKGTIQLGAGDTSGSFILTEQFTDTATGVSGATTGPIDVQVFKIAWGSTGEFYWADEETSGSGTAGAGAGPLPIQLRDSSGNPISSTTINGSSNRMLDVNIRNQTGTASILYIANKDAGNYATGGAYVAVAGTTNGAYVPVAGSTAGAAIPHIGATIDAYIIPATGGTAGWQGTISSKLRTMTSALYLMKHGGTGADGNYYASGISADIRSSSTLTMQATGGMTAAISAIAGGVTIGIGSVSIDNPVTIASRTAGATFEQVIGASTTLQSGVRVKNIAGSGTITITYDSTAGTTTGMTGGFELDDREEIFVEVDNLNKVYVKSGVTYGITFSYYAT